MPIESVLATLGSSWRGLEPATAAQRLATVGDNSLAHHRAKILPVLLSQVRSPLLVLLVVAAAGSFVVGEQADAVIIGVIVALSVGLSVVNEYRAARAADLLHDQIKRQGGVLRGGRVLRIPVTELVPGDIVHQRLGDIVSAK
jgi:P-type Mg2+ transporter